MENLFIIDKTEKRYSITLTQNIHWRVPHLKWKYEFDTVDEVCNFIENELGTKDNNIRKRDSERDHGSLASTSWYTVIKGYRDIPECMLW